MAVSPRRSHASQGSRSRAQQPAETLFKPNIHPNSYILAQQKEQRELETLSLIQQQQQQLLQQQPGSVKVSKATQSRRASRLSLSSPSHHHDLSLPHPEHEAGDHPEDAEDYHQNEALHISHLEGPPEEMHSHSLDTRTSRLADKLVARKLVARQKTEKLAEHLKEQEVADCTFRPKIKKLRPKRPTQEEQEEKAREQARQQRKREKRRERDLQRQLQLQRQAEEAGVDVATLLRSESVDRMRRVMMSLSNDAQQNGSHYSEESVVGEASSQTPDKIVRGEGEDESNSEGGSPPPPAPPSSEQKMRRHQYQHGDSDYQVQEEEDEHQHEGNSDSDSDSGSSSEGPPPPPPAPVYERLYALKDKKPSSHATTVATTLPKYLEELEGCTFHPHIEPMPRRVKQRAQPIRAYEETVERMREVNAQRQRELEAAENMHKEVDARYKRNRARLLKRGPEPFHFQSDIRRQELAERARTKTGDKTE